MLTYAHLLLGVLPCVLASNSKQVEQIEREAEEDEARALPIGVGLPSLTAEVMSRTSRECRGMCCVYVRFSICLPLSLYLSTFLISAWLSWKGKQDLSDDEDRSLYGDGSYDDGELSETESQYEAEMGLALQVSAEEERILQAFMSRDAEKSKTRTLADIIMDKIRDKTTEVNAEASGETGSRERRNGRG